MPKASESSPLYVDTTMDMTYRGFKDDQYIKCNVIHCTTTATEFNWNDEGAICPASQTGVKCYIPVPGLKIGDRIVGYILYGRVTSGGNAVTVDADFMKVPKAGTPADPTGDNSNDITQVSKTAAYTMDEACTFSAKYTVVTDETYNIMITATTGAGCTAIVHGADVIVDRK